MSGGGGIPPGARKIVTSLKEIVNCPETEIYAMLKECGMDPSETVERLLTQDTFHEVKSKREKKKEVKEISETRYRAISTSSGHGIRRSNDYGGRNNTIEFNPNNSGVSHGNTMHKKEKLENAITTSSSVFVTSACYLDKSATTRSDSISMEKLTQPTVPADGVSLQTQPSSGSWFGVPGRHSMADVVKMGKPQGRPHSLPVDPACPSPNISLSDMPPLPRRPAPSVLPSQSNQELDSSQSSMLKVTELTLEEGASAGQHISQDNLALVEESPAGAVSSALETSTFHADGPNLHVNSNLDETQEVEDDVVDESAQEDPIGSLSVSDRQVQLDTLGDNSQLADDSVNNLSSYQSHMHTFEHEVGGGRVKISAVVANLHQLNLQKEELGASALEELPAVIIPDHLQVTNADCSHLSFGSFGSGINSAFSGPYTSKAMRSDLDVAPVEDDTNSADQPDVRNTSYYNNGDIRSTLNENAVATTGSTLGDFDTPSSSQPEIIRSDSLDVSRGIQYNIASVSGYTLHSTTEPNVAAYVYPQSNSQMQNLAPFSSLLQTYSNALPSNSLASSSQPVRNFDLPLSPLLTTQSVPTKYSTSVSTISGPTSSMPEDVKPGVFSTPLPAQQSFPSTSIPTGHTLPQHLPVHAYAQPTLPLGHFANMIGYPYLPQSYAYMPSAFQQTYTPNGAFHQSPTAVHNTSIKYTLPQYKSNLPVTSLPQSASVAAAYGGFGTSTNIAGSVSLNPSTASANAPVGFEDALSSQYKEGNHHIPKQIENPAMWAHGAGSRTMSSMPASTFYSFLGQNQLSGYRQGQQSSHLGNLSYPNFYHSQAGISQEHQQNLHEGNSNNSQGPQSQQSHQLWQHTY